MFLRGCFSATPALIFAAALLATSAARAENWPAWRGPAGTGVSSEKHLPIAWNEEAGVRWKAEIPEWGRSTPIVWEDAVFITTQAERDLLLLRIDKRDGRIVWTHKLGTGAANRNAEFGRAKFHRLHNLASPSPVTDGEVVVAHFGEGTLGALDFEGNRLWQRNLQEDYGRYSIWWGHANSPVLYDDLVVSVCMQDSLAEEGSEPRAKSYVVAHELATGKLRWYTERRTGAEGEARDAYTTPVLRHVDDRTELVVMGGNRLDAYDPETGERRWYLPNLVGGRTITGPTVAHDMVYATEGKKGPLLAVRPSGLGELSRRDIEWRYRQGMPDTCCPVVWSDLLFAVSDDGVARCIDARTGHLQWKHRLKGDYKASPIAVHGRIYFLNTAGLCTVVSAAPRFDKLTENRLDAETLASPIASDGRLFIRGRKHLYCIGY